MSRLPRITEDAATWFAVASSLTARDRELRGHLSGGRSTGQIAAAMGISSNTVRTRIRRLAGKLDAAVTGDAGWWLAVVPALTARDGELLAHLADGRSTGQIAAAMAVSTNTVRGRVRRLAPKMDAALAALDGHPVPAQDRPGLPPLSDGLLSRPRLLDALSRAVQSTPVTLLSGRIGAGKTVLAHCWADAQPADAPPGWLPLAAGDENPATFWSHADAALTRAGVDHDDAPPGRTGRPCRGLRPGCGGTGRSPSSWTTPSGSPTGAPPTSWTCCSARPPAICAWCCARTPTPAPVPVPTPTPTAAPTPAPTQTQTPIHGCRCRPTGGPARAARSAGTSWRSPPRRPGSCSPAWAPR